MKTKFINITQNWHRKIIFTQCENSLTQNISIKIKCTQKNSKFLSVKNKCTQKKSNWLKINQNESHWLKMKNKMTQSDSLSRHILINIDQNYFQYWSILISILINIDFQCINIDHILFQYWSILKVENQNSPKIAHWGGFIFKKWNFGHFSIYN